MAADAGAAQVRVGVLSDIQYADVDDGADFSGKEKRYFRSSLKITHAAVECFNRQGVDAVVTMGDAVDAQNAKAGASETALASVLDALSRLSMPRYDLIGNHELYNFQREVLPCSGLNVTGGSGKTYHSVIMKSWELVFLDAFEQSMIGLPEGHPDLQAAKDLLNANNPNVLATTGVDWFEGLPVEKHRWVPYNGAFSPAQITWLKETLAAAAAAGRKAIIFTHVPLLPAATKPCTVAWNAEDALATLHEQKDTVVAVFAGHDHLGGYAVDAAGVHHMTMNAPLTAQPGSECWAVLECFEDWARLQCFGRAVVESDTHGKGRHYPELILAKGVENVPV